ncbi:serpin B [Nocardiopsis mwathae]|uniref:Serpin B n=1 Tax=Nocardiopsis mwathae TaxID=1472723 RepID=A0A7W9YFP5_9ACTN|nr:serpin B [Nocardiopsis mwathae]
MAVSVSLRPDHVAFALRLHTELSAAADPAGFVWSPYSVASALGLVATGTRGATRAELTGLLGQDLSAHLAALDDAVADGPELATTTGLWVRDDVAVRPEFEADVRARPESAVHTADFGGDPEGVRTAVNSEVAKVTRGMIDELLLPGTVRTDTQAVLLNALWARLRWPDPFDPAATAPRDFHTPRGTREVPMMRRESRLPYAQADGWSMVTLGGDHDLALDVLLADRADAALTPEALKRLYRKASPTTVDLSLPRFELTHRSELNGPLADTGVRTVFTDAADLGGISARRLRIDQVIHQAVLRVDEKGAEGAAATAVMVALAAAFPARPVVFTADRPFTVILRRRSAILFLGHVADPQDPGPA